MAGENALNVTYNGITIRCSALKSWDRTPVFQGPDFLYTTHRIHMVGVIHREYDVGQEGVGRNFAGGINTRPMDEQDADSILVKLQQPRKKLTVRLLDGEPWIETELDASQGPAVVAHRISTLMGVNHCFVEVVVEFNHHTAKRGKIKPPLILSNRWEMVEDTDEYFRKRISVRGRAIFRRDFIEKQYEPDQFREYLLWPLQKGWKRIHRRAGVGPTGVELIYETVDVQTSLDVLLASIADMQVIHEYTHSTPSPGDIVFARQQFNFRTLSQTVTAAAGVMSDPTKASIPGGVGVVGSRAIDMQVDRAAMNYALLPRHQGKLTVWAKGTPHSRIIDLANATLAVHNMRLTTLPLACPGVRSHHTIDFQNREVTLETVHEASPVEQNLKVSTAAWSGGSTLLNRSETNLNPANLGPFYLTEVNVPKYLTTAHTHPKDAPGPFNRGDGDRIMMIAKALIDDITLPPSGLTESSRAKGKQVIQPGGR